MALIRRRYPFTQSLTFIIIALNIVVWVLQIVAYPVVDDLFALSAASFSEGRVYQFLTYMFLHATYVETSAGVVLYPGHIAVNMLVFAIFGFQLEQVVGRKKFLALYFISGVGSALFYLFVMDLMMGAYGASLIGASGAVFGVIAAYAFRFPKEWVYMLGFFPMPASVMLVFFLVEETFFGFMGLEPGVANFGHVGGIITGLLLMTIWKIAEARKEKEDFRHFEYVWE